MIIIKTGMGIWNVIDVGTLPDVKHVVSVTLCPVNVGSCDLYVRFVEPCTVILLKNALFRFQELSSRKNSSNSSNSSSDYFSDRTLTTNT